MGNGREKKDRLKVVIVGGSIGGLTLAHSLDASNIDYVVLEGRKEIAPQVGASIVILPNGARIFDQLGVFDDILDIIEPFHVSMTWDINGRKLGETDFPVLAGLRMGYKMTFMQRKDLLEVLYKKMKDKSKVLTSKKVTHVTHLEDGVVVHCEDGSSFNGDIVVGADGIHSKIRECMQEHKEKIAPGSTAAEENNLSSAYNCIFGISNPVDGEVTIGEGHRTYTESHSTLSFVGNGGRIFWFLFSRLDKVYHGKEIPRYSTADADEAAKAFDKIPFTDTITFDKVWKTREIFSFSALQEYQTKNWTVDRFVCFGDAMHKMTPNMGAGGSAAVESAAALANVLRKLDPNPSVEQIREAMNLFYEKRSLRANTICDAANLLTRLEAMANPLYKLLALYGLPALGKDFLADLTCDMMVGAEKLDALPLPARSLTATMPWDAKMGVTKHERKWVRALNAIPLLAIVYGCHKFMGMTVSQLLPTFQSIVKSGSLVLGDGQSAAIPTKYFGVKVLDKLFTPLVALFTPAIGGLDTASRSQLVTFLGDLIPLQAIWMIEGLRRGNLNTIPYFFPTLFATLGQTVGHGYIAPLYYFFHYVQSPLENYAAADNRLTNVGSVKTIIPTVALSYILPSIAMFTAPGLNTRQWINGFFWQPFPIYAAVMQRVLYKMVKDTTWEDRTTNPRADMHYLRRVYGFAFATSALAYWYMRFTSPTSVIDTILGGLRDPGSSQVLLENVAKIFRYDYVATSASGAAWVLLSFNDLKKAKKIQAGWGKIVGIYLSTLLIGGPGAAMAAMWAWREEALAFS